jgi:UDP-N-acetylglucosamine:LPS N-acetylglucosamine transferase
MNRILILTSKTGGGHVSLAEAIKEGILETSPKTKVFIKEGLQSIYPFLCQLSVIFFPETSAFVYWLTNTRIYARIFHYFNYLLCRQRLIKSIKETQPDLVFSVHPLLTKEIVYTLSELKLRIPLMMVVTDPFLFHKTFLCPESKLIFVGTEFAKKELIRYGISKEKIINSGWPIRKKFFKTAKKKNKEFTVLITGGGEGGGQLEKIVIPLLNQKNLKIIILCGKNKKLLNNLKAFSRPSLLILSYVKNPAFYYHQADLIIGKAGPNTIFEALATGKPFLATCSVSGQEKANLNFIEKAGIGWVEKNPKKVVQLIKLLTKTPKKLAKLKPNIQRLRRFHLNASQIIASHIIHCLTNSTRAKRR